MANLSEDIQCAGSDTRPPMLDKTDFASWQQRIRLYCRGKENGVNILKSIDEGPMKTCCKYTTMKILIEPRNLMLNQCRAVWMALTGVEQDDWSMEFDAEHMHFGQDGLGDFDWSNKADDAPVSLSLMLQTQRSRVPQSVQFSRSTEKGHYDPRVDNSRPRISNYSPSSRILLLQETRTSLSDLKSSRGGLCGPLEMKLKIKQFYPINQISSFVDEDLKLEGMSTSKISTIVKEAIWKENYADSKEQGISCDDVEDMDDQQFIVHTAQPMPPEERTAAKEIQSDEIDTPTDASLLYKTYFYAEEGGVAELTPNWTLPLKIPLHQTLRIHKIHPQIPNYCKSNCRVSNKRKLQDSTSKHNKQFASFINKQNRTNPKISKHCLLLVSYLQEGTQASHSILSRISRCKRSKELLQFKPQEKQVENERGTITTRTKHLLVANKVNQQERRWIMMKVLQPVPELNAIRLILALHLLHGFEEPSSSQTSSTELQALYEPASSPKSKDMLMKSSWIYQVSIVKEFEDLMQKEFKMSSHGRTHFLFQRHHFYAMQKTILIVAISSTEAEYVQLQVLCAQLTSIGSREEQSTILNFYAASSARVAQGTPTQSAAHSQRTASFQGTATSQGTAPIQRTADFQGTAEPHDAASIPKSPNDYTPTDASQTSLKGDEGDH
ncbi:hypothetical protein Tco_0445767 [Tanacetum coccineum]